VPNSISPATYISGFTNAYNSEADFACAIATNSTEVVKKMSDACCKGSVDTDDGGCYHWCKPLAKDLIDWATCISDKVYTDTNFGQVCNAPGAVALQSAEQESETVPAGLKSAGPRSIGFKASWKMVTLLGFVGLVNTMC
jgi:hypothetical protein